MKQKGSFFNYLFLSVGFVVIFVPLYFTGISSFKKTKQITDIVYKFMKNIEGINPLLIGRKKHLLL